MVPRGKMSLPKRPDAAPTLQLEGIRLKYLSGLVNQQVFVYLPGGGVLRGTLASCAEDHIVMKCQEEKKGGEKVDLERFVSRHAIQWVEANKGQRVD